MLCRLPCPALVVVVVVAAEVNTTVLSCRQNKPDIIRSTGLHNKHGAIASARRRIMAAPLGMLHRSPGEPEDDNHNTARYSFTTLLGRHPVATGGA